jgi:hypothetical protein
MSPVDRSTTPDHETQHDDRHLLRGFILIFFAALAVVVLVVTLGLFLREGPEDYTLHPPTSEGRHEMIRRASGILRDVDQMLEGSNDAMARARRDTAKIVIAIQQFAIANEGRLPRTLEEAGISPDDIEPGLRYSYGRTNWRLFQTNYAVLARGN